MYRVGDTVLVRRDIDATNSRMLHDLVEHNYICVIERVGGRGNTDYPIDLFDCYGFYNEKDFVGKIVGNKIVRCDDSVPDW